MSTTTNPIAFVTGATGAQGSAVARQLRALGWGVHITARTPSSPIAQHLQSLGVSITPGDWDDETALISSFSGCTHLFLNLTPNFQTFTPETAHARSILTLAHRAGVRHVVYSSATTVGRLEAGAYPPDSLLATMASWKQAVEGLVRDAGFDTWTILRGAYFMQNMLAPKVHMLYPGFAASGTLVTAYRADSRLPVVDTEDIARFAVAAFRDPGTFAGQTIALASEYLGLEEMVKLIGKVAGKELKAEFLADEEVEARKGKDMLIMSQVLTRDADGIVDIEKTKAWGVPMGTFRSFLEREVEAVKETYA